jgi:hypothetical protein
MVIPPNDTDPPIQLAHANITVPRIGETVPLRLSTSHRTVIYPCEVLEMPKGYDFLIGTDTFFTFGFGIAGLPGLGSELQKSVPHPVDDEYASLVPLQTPEVEKSSTFVILRSKFLQSIRDFLDENAAIPHGSFCSLEGSEVRLRTPDGAAIWIRQYPIAHHHEPVVDKAIEDWLADGTITWLRTRSPFNTPLILVSKKDIHGKRTEFRPCLDFRHLNALLEEEKFELPLIRDIFSAVNGSVIFTTIDLRKAYHRFRIAEKDIHKTAFTWKNKQYAFLGAPFGLKTLPSIFQSVMSSFATDCTQHCIMQMLRPGSRKYYSNSIGSLV